MKHRVVVGRCECVERSFLYQDAASLGYWPCPDRVLSVGSVYALQRMVRCCYCYRAEKHPPHPYRLA